MGRQLGQQRFGLPQAHPGAERLVEFEFEFEEVPGGPPTPTLCAGG